MDVLVGVVEQFSQLIGLALGDEGGPLLDAGGSGRLADLGVGGDGEYEAYSEGREDGAKEAEVHQEMVGRGRWEGREKRTKKRATQSGSPFRSCGVDCLFFIVVVLVLAGIFATTLVFRFTIVVIFFVVVILIGAVMAAGGWKLISPGVNSVCRAVPFIPCRGWWSAEEESDEGDDEELNGAG